MVDFWEKSKGLPSLTSAFCERHEAPSLQLPWGAVSLLTSTLGITSKTGQCLTLAFSQYEICFQRTENTTLKGNHVSQVI